MLMILATTITIFYDATKINLQQNKIVIYIIVYERYFKITAMICNTTMAPMIGNRVVHSYTNNKNNLRLFTCARTSWNTWVRSRKTSYNMIGVCLLIILPTLFMQDKLRCTFDAYFVVQFWVFGLLKNKIWFS